jgi:tellurite resistance protein
MDQAQQPTLEQTLVAPQSRIQYFPISFFAVILGLGGTTIAVQRAESILELPFTFGIYLLGLTLLLFVAISGIYLYKLVRYPAEVKHELAHPIKINFFPTFSIALLLLSISFLGIHDGVSFGFWLAGALAHLLFTLGVMSVWINSDAFHINHSNPAWFIPVVGNLIVPVAGVEHASKEIGWFFFSIGFIFWILLFATFFYRIIFHSPMPQKLLPTLFIMVAPPAVGFIAYTRLMEQEVAGFGVDPFGRVLYYFALFLFIMLLTQYRLFYRIKFYLSWWAYSFPIAAMTIASLLMFHKTDAPFFQYTAVALLLFLGGVIITLIIRTIHAIRQRGICVAED